jgi:hypothetical protein
MSDPSLFASPLVRQAARNLRTVEWLSENNTWRSNWFCRWYFWSTRRIMAMTPDEAAAWLPALAFAVSCEKDDDVLFELVRQPLPEPLPPEALPWRDRLIQVWEQYRPVTDGGETIRLAALVRLDRRAERLPEWLREARRALDLWWYDRDFRLAALASWRPRPGDAPPHGDKAEAAQAWVRFWEERYRPPGSELASLRAFPGAAAGGVPPVDAAVVCQHVSGPAGSPDIAVFRSSRRFRAGTTAAEHHEMAGTDPQECSPGKKRSRLGHACCLAAGKHPGTFW